MARHYQETLQNPLESKSVKALRFLEVSSSIIHDIIGGYYNQVYPNNHKSRDRVRIWRFVHTAYKFSGQFRNSYGSTTAYWAETVIFGGPVLFCRGEDEEQV